MRVTGSMANPIQLISRETAVDVSGRATGGIIDFERSSMITVSDNVTGAIDFASGAALRCQG